ncbi:MAG: type III-B CRISPR module RAMP protein Cmr1 [Natronincolaceae bacterium]|jgi:CRISPR-associated protein Cmr1
MNIIEACYVVNTKMFLGSADNKFAEIRPPSFKGVLRFWFRALALAELGGDKCEVERLEGILFGTTRGKNVQKALYSLKIEGSDIIDSKGGYGDNRPGIAYLGYGLKGRGFIEQNSKIKVLLIENFGIKRKVNEGDYEIGKKLLQNSLKAIGIFGGLGSRSRKGFGSLTLVKLEENGQAQINFPYCGEIDELKNEINQLLEKAIKLEYTDDNIPYTAFSKGTKIIITREFDSSTEVLDEIGKEMIRYRSYGRRGKIFNEEKSEKIFEDDHNLAYDYIKGKNTNKHPTRVVFGLPHNYFLSAGWIININSTNRRASPLFIHIHKLQNGKYIGILTLIPAKFLKNQDGIEISKKRVRARGINLVTQNKLKADIDYKIIKGFLDRIVDKMGGVVIWEVI